MKKVYTITSGDKIIQPNYEDINAKMGMHRGDKYGNLIIRFIVTFPSSLNDEQRKLLKTAL